ncbi:hypothetical protein CSPX01_13620 [Colletotrichum filicis]|nr:hypothetical protein CSPX01_13620 [Colletotrichum filicis]
MAKPETKTGVKVIVVGAGFGGLTTAIECHRQGHDVKVYESFPELKQLGDIISFGANAGRIFHRWSNGAVVSKLKPLCIDLHEYGFRIHKWDTGEVVLTQKRPPADPEAPVLNGHRGELHEVIYNYAKDELAIPIHLGQPVTDYFEDQDAAGIQLQDGSKVSADVVIAADGVRSKARELVLGHKDKPQSSGYAIWRAWFSADALLADPRTRQFYEYDIDESWSFPGKIEDVCRALEGWDPMCRVIVEKTPSLVDWKLMYRDALPNWVSGGGRIALLGDAVHPFLPTSTQGATQAMEDGVTIAVCLKRAGKKDIRTALNSYQGIRYDRVRAVQKTGVSTREMWHKTDWEKVKEDPTTIALPREDWILEFDAEKHAEETYERVATPSL